MMELVDSRLESLKFLVHIFRVVDLKITVTGKKAWANHFIIVDGHKGKNGRNKLRKVRIQISLEQQFLR